MSTESKIARAGIKDGWKHRRNPTWAKRLRAWIRVLVAEKSYASPDRCFRCYRSEP